MRESPWEKRKGEFLGDGCAKHVYVDLESPDRVLAFVDGSGCVNDENDNLDLYRRNNVPTVEGWTYEGKDVSYYDECYDIRSTRYVYSMPRYVADSRCNVWTGSVVHLLLNSIRMARKLRDCGIRQGDIQFLISSEGNLFVSDPLSVGEGRQDMRAVAFEVVRSLPYVTVERLTRGLPPGIRVYSWDDPGNPQLKLVQWFMYQVDKDCLIRPEKREATCAPQPEYVQLAP